MTSSDSILGSNWPASFARYDLNLCIAILPEHIVAYHAHEDKAWQLVPIKGNTEYKHLGQSHDVRDILVDISRRFNLDNHKLTEVNISLLYVPELAHWIKQFIDNLLSDEFANNSWRVLGWNQIYGQACQLSQHQPQLPQDYVQHDWICQHMLPLLWPENSIQQHHKLLAHLQAEKKLIENQLESRQVDAELSRTEMLLKLEREKQALQHQVKQVKEQLALAKQPELEQLLAYLPFVFKDFWNIVRPDELANLAGFLTTPNIPSPYHSPGLSAVQQKKRQFLTLSADSQGAVTGYCRELAKSYNTLIIHQEFRTLVGELD